MNKFWLFLLSAVLVSCQMIRGNIPETRDLQSGQQGDSSGVDIADAQKELEARKADINRDVETLLAGRYVASEGTRSSRMAGHHGCTTKTLDFQGNHVVLREIDYFADRCEGDIRGEIRVSGRMRVGFLSADNALKRNMDIEVIRVEAVAAAKGWGFTRAQLSPDPCGIRTMSTGDVRSLAGQSCGSFGKFPAPGEVFFTSLEMNSSQRIGIPLSPLERNDLGSPEERAMGNSEVFERR